MKPVHPDWQARVRRWMHVRDGDVWLVEDGDLTHEEMDCACGQTHMAVTRPAAECAYWDDERTCYADEHRTDADIIAVVADYLSTDADKSRTTVTLDDDELDGGWCWSSAHRRALADALARVGVYLDPGTDDWTHEPTVELSWRRDAASFRAKAAKGTALQDIAVMYADD